MGTVTGYESGKRTMEHALPIAIAMAVAFPPKWLSKFIEHVSLATQENGCLTTQLLYRRPVNVSMSTRGSIGKSASKRTASSIAAEKVSEMRCGLVMRKSSFVRVWHRLP